MGITLKKKWDLKELIQHTLLSLKLPETVRVNKSFRTDLSMIKAGTAQLSRAFMNIIQNAIDAMEEGGSLSISARNVELNDSIKNYHSVRTGHYVKIDH